MAFRKCTQGEKKLIFQLSDTCIVLVTKQPTAIDVYIYMCDNDIKPCFADEQSYLHVELLMVQTKETITVLGLF